MSTIRIRVDQDRCQGHARCKAVAPDLFRLDEYGNAHEAIAGPVPDALIEQAHLARSNCPENAIEIIEG